MMFELKSTYSPTGDQPEAINKLLNGLKKKIKSQCLLGVTGSGKTFTMANVIEKHNTPTLILCHNKTLAAQLYEEFKTFFPNNAVEYFVSYYDYYQPEAYLPATNTYIEKDLSINEEIEKLRISTTTSLLSGRKDVIVISSVSCIYGLGNPSFFKEKSIQLNKNLHFSRKKLIICLIDALYTRTENTILQHGEFKVVGDTIIIHPSNADVHYKIIFWGNEIEKIQQINYLKQKKLDLDNLNISPANIFVTSKKNVQNAIPKILNELEKQFNHLIKNKQTQEAERLKSRVHYDMEMIKELGYCSGIENYSRYLDGRQENERPFCLMDYFSENFLLIIDESHVTLPQVKAMHGGDQSRKKTLVEYGFRLPSALDNRPLNFKEFENIKTQTVFLSATPGDYEIEKCHGVIVEQLIRPTGLLEPSIIIEKSQNQIDHLINQINIRIKKQQRTLVTTLTKKMAEKLSEYLIEAGIKTTYIHSDIDTIERIEIMKNLRQGNIDVLIGVNLLREGLDLPEVSLVAILDADKEGFLRSRRSLIQTIGRAARHIEGTSILYADVITDSIKATINDNKRKLKIQKQYNQTNNITPKPLVKKILSMNNFISNKKKPNDTAELDEKALNKMSLVNLKKKAKDTKKLMHKAAIEMDFHEAAKQRDYLFIIEKKISNF
ncbi:MAG: excinuclease ABC subunit UvrB [Flavobacteriales bacterium TMED191]|nr:MAG: excinuclease ABC subunit UvrB [Flavobacteriales bacterium TMED191]